MVAGVAYGAVGGAIGLGMGGWWAGWGGGPDDRPLGGASSRVVITTGFKDGGLGGGVVVVQA